MSQVYLITSHPGTGKTSLIKEAISELGDKAGGFYTEAIMGKELRKGFKLVTLDGVGITLAHVNFDSKHKVGRYGVDIEALERVGVPAIRQAAKQGKLVVIDEIGKMELLSAEFRKAIKEIIEGGHHILGTIMLSHSPQSDTIRQRPEVDIVPLTGSNNRQVLLDVKNWLKRATGAES